MLFSYQLNALPEYTTAAVNYRIDFLSSVNATLEHVAAVIAPIAARHNLTLDAFGSNPDAHPEDGSTSKGVIRASVVPRTALEPAPITPTVGAPFELMSGTIKSIWQDVIVAPSGMIGECHTQSELLQRLTSVSWPCTLTANSDTKWTWQLTRHIYRFTPARVSQISGYHTVNEKLHKDAHLSAIQFYYTLARNLEGWSD